MVVVAIWLVFAILVGIAASSRGRSGFRWFCLAVLLSPLITIFVLLVLPDLQVRDMLAELRRGGVDDREGSRKVGRYEQ
jgi:hypothetical protein